MNYPLCDVNKFLVLFYNFSEFVSKRLAVPVVWICCFVFEEVGWQLSSAANGSGVLQMELS